MKDAQNTHLESLAAADLLLLIARILAPPHSSAAHEWLVDEQEQRQLLDAADMGDRPELAEALRQVMAEARQLTVADWADQYTELFDGPIICPINETAYVRRDKGIVIADICGFYQAFGFEPTSHMGEKPDHLVCELEFAAMLVVLAAEARRKGRDEPAETAEAALRSFAADHLGEWIGAFDARLHESASLRAYAHVAELMQLTWQALMERLGLPVSEQAAASPIGLDKEPGTPYECGMAEAEAAVDLRVRGRSVTPR